MKRYLIVGFIVLCITFVNIFALENFVQRQKSHTHDSCVLFEHHHYHTHHNIEHSHSHGHNHKINLVDFYSNKIFEITASLYKDNKHFELKILHNNFIPSELLRPPIA